MITKNKIVKIIELAKKCNECAIHHFKEFDNKLVSYKDDNSPLTNADIKVNEIAVNVCKQCGNNLLPSFSYFSSLVDALKDIKITDVTLEQAKQLLKYPYSLGKIDGKDAILAIGKYGKYLKMNITRL